jgi:hypothetical protein
MAAYTPPPSPGTLRSSRNIALAKGTSREGFAGVAGYDAAAGVPVLPGVTTSGHYQELAPQISTSGSPINTSTPFANLKK